MISTHILDTNSGQPAGGVKVILEKKGSQGWETLLQDSTNSDGRISFDCSLEKGIFRLNFDVEDYFNRKSKECFYENIPVVFKIENINRKYHVPLLLNSYGYTTYRGS